MPKTTFNRCRSCWLHIDKCICAYIQSQNCQHKVTIVTRAKEQRIVSNTGRYISMILPNSQIVRLDIKGWEQIINNLIQDTAYHHILFFPNPNTKPANQICKQLTKPLNIIILDTSWSSARRWARKKTFLNIPKIELKKHWQSNYLLRTTTQNNGLCTLESLACLLCELQDSKLNPAINMMNKVLKKMVLGMGSERGKLFARNS